VTSRPAATQHLLDLAGLRRVRDRIDRDYAQPLDVQALVRGVHLSAGHLSRQFKLAYGESPHPHLQATRRTRGVTTTPLNDKEADRCDAL
jgi:AraC-like DNA-binding protein